MGRLAPNEALRAADVLAASEVKGPEDVALSQDGSTSPRSATRGFSDCAPMPPADRPETFAVTGGAPVDLAFAADGRLFACDWSRGVLSIDESGEVTDVLPLGTPIDGLPFVRPDGVAVGDGGMLYLTEGSRAVKAPGTASRRCSRPGRTGG